MHANLSVHTNTFMGQEKERQTLKTGLLSREDFLKQVLFCSFHVLFLKYLFAYIVCFIFKLGWAIENTFDNHIDS